MFFHIFAFFESGRRRRGDELGENLKLFLSLLMETLQLLHIITSLFNVQCYLLKLEIDEVSNYDFFHHPTDPEVVSTLFFHSIPIQLSRLHKFHLESH